METVFLTSPSQKNATEQIASRHRARLIRERFPYQRGAKVSR